MASKQNKQTAQQRKDSSWAQSLRKIAIQEFVTSKLSGTPRTGRFGARYEKPLTGNKLNYALSDVLEVLNAFEGTIDEDSDSKERLIKNLEEAKKNL